MKFTLNSKQRVSKEEFLKNIPDNFYNAHADNQIIEYEIKNFKNSNLIKIFILYLKKYLIFFIGILILLCIIISSSIFIRDIKFVGVQDNRIYNEVMENFEKIGPFYYPKTKINILEGKLRSTYPEYAWIGLKRNASLLYIEIDKIDIENKDEIIPQKPGDIISTFNGKIEKMTIFKGKSLVNIGDVVKKGQILVSGAIDENHHVTASAIILATTYTYSDVIVPKIYNFKIIENIDRKISFTKNNEFNYENNVLFDFKLFKVYKVIKKEEKLISEFRNYDEAYLYAQSIIQRNFNLNHDLNLEYIKNIEFLKVSEDEINYNFHILVNKYENIAEFVEY